MTNNEDIKWLYGKLIGQGYDIGTEEEFTSSLSNSDDRDWYYNKAIKMGLDVGSKDEFDSLFAPQVPTPEAKVTQTPQAPQAPSAPKVGSLNWYTAETAGDAVKNVADNSVLASATKAKNTEATDNLAKVKGTADVAQNTQGLINTTPIESKALELAQFKAKNKAMFDSMAQRTADMGEYYTKAGANVGKVVETAPEYNAETGEFDTQYITPTLNREDNKAIADAEAREYKHWIDVQNKYVAPVNMTTSAQLRRAKERLRDVDEKIKERTAQLDAEHEAKRPSGFLGWLSKASQYASNAGVGGPALATASDRFAYDTDDVYQSLRLAQRKLQEEIQQLENKEVNNQKGERFWADFGRHAGQTLTSVDLWDFGVNSIKDARTISQLAQKVENSETLTDAEETALYELYMSDAVKNHVGDLGDGARWGEMGAHSLAFGAQLLLTGGGFGNLSYKGASWLAKGAVKAVAGNTKSLGLKLAEQGLFKTITGSKGAFGKLIAEQGVGRTISIASTRALGVGAENLLVRAPLVVGTVQSLGTTAKTIESKYGPVYLDDETGDLRFVNDKTWGKAAWETFADASIEVASEMSGATKPALTTITKAFGARGLTAAILRATRENAGTVLSKSFNFLERMGVNGIFGEGLEEYDGQAWRTILRLESAKGADGENLIYDPAFHWDIWGGITSTAGLTSSAVTGVDYGIKGVKYGVNTGMRKYWEHQVDKASAQASRVFSAEQWENMRQIIDATDNADMSALAQQTLADNSLSENQKHAALTYMERSMNLRGYNLGRYMQSKNGMLDADAEAVNQSYADGYESNDAQEMADARKAVEVEESKLRNALSGIDQEGVNAVMADVVADPVTAMQRAEDEALRDAIADYANAKAVYDGMQQRVADDIDTQIAVSDATIDRRTNRNTGKIQSVTLKNDKKVYVVGGTLNTTENGSVDFEHSDESIIVMDETGALEYSSPNNVLSIDNEIDPVEEKAISAEAIRQQAQAQAEANMSGKLTFTAGEQVQIKQEDGTFLNGTIVGPYAEDGKVFSGLVEVETQDGTKLPFEADVLQSWADEARQARVEQFDAERQAQRDAIAEQQAALEAEAPVAEEETKPLVAEFNQDDKFTIDINGKDMSGTVLAPINDDGFVEVLFNTPQGEVTQMMTPDVLNGLLTSYNGVSLVAEEAPIAEGATTLPEAEATEVPEVMEAPQSALDRVPTDEQGNPIYEQVDAETAWDAIVEQTQGDVAMAQTVANDMVKDKEKALKAAQNSKSKGGATIAEKIASEQERKANIQNAEQELAIWQAIASVPKVRQQAIAEAQAQAEAEQKAYGREEAVGLPVALEYLLEGGKGSIENAGYFLYGIQAAFPHIAAELQRVRDSIPSELLGMTPDSFVASNPHQLQEMRNFVAQSYRDKGVELFDKLTANSTGFIPREGKKVGLELENLTPVEAHAQAEEEAEQGEAGDIKPIGKGVFGNIYDQFKGKAKEAIAFLFKRKEGEAIGALYHPEIGEIDLVWGKEGTGKSDGFGLAKLAKYHPEVLENLQEILNDMHVTQRSVNRVQLESDTHQAAVRLTWDNESKNWLLTAFEKKNSAFDNTTDTDETSDRGKQNDTATLQNTVSNSKDTTSSQNNNEIEDKNVQPTIGEQVQAAEAERIKAEEAETTTLPEGEETEEGKTPSKSKSRKAPRRAVDAETEILRRLKEEWSDAPKDVKEQIKELADTSVDMTVEEVVYRALENIKKKDAKYRLLLTDEGVARGAVRMVGLSARELQKALGLNAFASRAKGGVSIEKLAEIIYQTMDKNIIGANQIDDTDLRDMLIEAIRTIGKPSDLSYRRDSLRIEMAERLYNDWKEQEERYAEEQAYWDAQQEAFEYAEEEWLKAQVKALEDLPEGGFMYIFADEFIQESKIRDIEHGQVNERSDSRDTILQGAQSDNTGRVEEGSEGRAISEGIGDALHIPTAETSVGGIESAPEWEVGNEAELTAEELEASDKAINDGNVASNAIATDVAIGMLKDAGVEVVEATDAMAEAVLAKGGVQMMSVPEAKRRADAIENLTPININGNTKTKEELKEDYKNLPSVNKAGNKIQFYVSAFKKIYKEGGLFGQIIPQLDKILEQSVLAYSEADNLGGTKRPDGTIHKAHPNVVSFDNYVGKVTINGKEYYVRTTVKSQRVGAGAHSFFVTEVDVYEKSANGLSVPNFPSGESDHQRIIDAKLQQFFDYANGKANKMQFHIATESTAPFYSNAKKAVLDIKQDKATPQMKEDVMKGQPMFLRTPNGTVYGWTQGGKVFLTKEGMNAETPIHEYTHLWDKMVQQKNPELWNRGKELLKQTPTWNEVVNDKNYANIAHDEDAVASEVHSRLSGENGAKVLERMINDARKDGAMAVAKAASITERIKEWIKDMFASLKETLSAWSKQDLADLSIEDFNNLTLRDLAEGVNPTEFVTEEGDMQFRAKRKSRALEIDESNLRQTKQEANSIIDKAVGIFVGGPKAAKAMRKQKEAERKALATEIYSKVLAGDFNPLTLQQIEKYINDVTPRNPFGNRISQRIPQEVERGVYGRESTSAIDLLFSRICESAVSAPRRFSEEGRREIEERKKEALKGWAIATGNWHTDLSEFTNDKEPFAQGTDSKVYTSKYGGYVIKASKGKPYGKRFRADIDNVALFNHIFPNSKYDIVGYGEIDGNFVRILRQPFVDFSQSDILTEEERVAYMAELGFKPLNKENTAFSNGDFVVADLQKANIVRDVTGNIRVIDADVKLHTTDTGGNYSYAPVENDIKIEEDSNDQDISFSIVDAVEEMVEDAKGANEEQLEAKQNAIAALGGDLSKLRRAMSAQRKYDKFTIEIITRMAKEMLDNGMLGEMSHYAVKRLLGAIERVHGKQDVSKEVNSLINIMIDTQLQNCAASMAKMLKVKGSKVNATGVQVQGVLDADGEAMVKAFKRAIKMQKEDVEERLTEVENRMQNANEVVANDAKNEYYGLQLALQYMEEIKGSKAEEVSLRRSLEDAKADRDAGMMTQEGYRQYVKSVEDAIQQNKMERAEAYRTIMAQLGGLMGESIERAKAWREAEAERVNNIHHYANSDMEGRKTNEHRKDTFAQKFMSFGLVKILLSPYATFDQMLRMFGKKNVRGEGYLYRHFMDGWMRSTENEYTGYRDALKELDAKAKEVFGDKAMRWGHLIKEGNKPSNITVDFWDGDEIRPHTLTVGNLLYIYMVNKMSDGQMKLRHMGITEEQVDAITRELDPEYIALADWLQETFLAEKREKYNEVHKRMFGTSMASIDNYFPLKILANARTEKVDVGEETPENNLPSTATGSIIKRKKNNTALDVMGTNAFAVILDHLNDMEHWAAFAEFNRDLNTLLSYKRFRNQVLNMNSTYGGGKELWQKFKDACAIAAGSYRAKTDPLDAAALKIAKGASAAKVAWRTFTALKQFSSLPAFVQDANAITMAKNMANPYKAWNWTMQNLPIAEKRWKSMVAGDPKLLQTMKDWDNWQSRISEVSTRYGMLPNAFVDAVSVSIGAYSVYETAKKRYLRYGYSEEQAEQRAKNDATTAFNQTQQSGETAYLSAMQVDRTWLSTILSVFRNNAFAFGRQLHDAFRGLGRSFNPNAKEFMAKQMMRQGLSEERAEKAAEKEIGKSRRRDLVRLFLYGGGLTMLWEIMSAMPYLLFGDDDEEKDEIIQTSVEKSLLAGFDGLAGGDGVILGLQWALYGEGKLEYAFRKDMPFISDVESMIRKFSSDELAALNDLANIVVQWFAGVNPQVMWDAMAGVWDYCEGDAQTAREVSMLMMNILACPQSQRDKVYLDEIDLSVAEASKLTPEQIAERYARYKVRRTRGVFGILSDKNNADSVLLRHKNKALKEYRGKLDEKVITEDTRKLLDEHAEVRKLRQELNDLKDSVGETISEEEYQARWVDHYNNYNPGRYKRVGIYKREANMLWDKLKKTEDPEEKDSLINQAVKLRDVMLKDIREIDKEYEEYLKRNR